MFRGEVWQMSMGVPGRKEGVSPRTVLIISSDALSALPLKIVVPLTNWKEEYTSVPWMVRLPPVLNSGLESPMAADAMQVRSVSTARLLKRLGEMPDTFADQISGTVALVLEGRQPAAIK